MGVTIRSALFAHLPGILEIYNEAVLNTTATYEYEVETLAERTAWFEEKQSAGYPVLVAEDCSGEVVGWGALGGFRGRFGYRFTAEDSVYVRVDQRGKGIGRLILSALIEEARKMGLHAIIAGIDTEGEASIRLHAALGFQKVGRCKEVGFKFGRWLDVVFMELLLS